MCASSPLLSSIVLVAFGSQIARGQTPAGAAWDSVAQILQAPVSTTGGYYRDGLPRRDVTLKIGGVTGSPAPAPGGWAGVSGGATDGTAMGGPGRARGGGEP